MVSIVRLWIISARAVSKKTEERILYAGVGGLEAKPYGLG